LTCMRLLAGGRINGCACAREGYPEVWAGRKCGPAVMQAL
jgi:hypothetical protein